MQIRECGERAVVLSVSYDKTEDAVRQVQSICRYIKDHPNQAIDSVRPGLDCVLIEFSRDIQDWLEDLSRMARGPQIFADDASAPQAAVTVPVCYEMGEDLREVASAIDLSTQEIVRLHTSISYQVWMIGFMPGFPYLGKLPKELQIPRKKTPAVSVPAGSVAIAEEYSGIYPLQSPGGWHIIGRTPLAILDYGRENPCLLDYGMEVQFTSISSDEFQRMKNEAAGN